MAACWLAAQKEAVLIFAAPSHGAAGRVGLACASLGVESRLSTAFGVVSIGLARLILQHLYQQGHIGMDAAACGSFSPWSFFCAKRHVA